MGDADDTYDFTQLGRFLGPLREGADMVIGNRMAGHPAGRDALASPLRRQPGPDRDPQPLLPHRRQRRALRDARLPPRPAAARSTCARPGWSSPPSMVIRAVEARPRHPRDRHRVPPAQGRVEALLVLGRLAPPALPARPQPDLALPRSRAPCWRSSASLGGHRRVTGVDLLGREWDLHALIASVAALIVGAQVLQIGVFARAFAAYYLGEHDPLFDRGATGCGSSTA